MRITTEWFKELQLITGQAMLQNRSVAAGPGQCVSPESRDGQLTPERHDTHELEEVEDDMLHYF